MKASKQHSQPSGFGADSQLDTQGRVNAGSSRAAIPVAEPRFRLAFEKAPLGMAIIDLNFKLQRANNALCVALGYSEPELIALNYTAITHPDDLNKGIEMARDLAAGKVPCHRVEKRFITKQGTLVWFDVTAVLIRDERNEPQYMLAMIDNCTERKRSLEALRASEERYRSFVVNSSEGIWRFEVEQPIDITLSVDEQIALFYKHAYLAECNDAMARMYGKTRADDLVGARFGELTLASNPTTTSALRKFVTQGYRLHEVETTTLDTNGLPRYMSNNVIGIVINGRLMRIWGTQQDQTQRRRAEEQLRASHAQLRSLAGRLQSIREQERREIALEMHDVLGQALTSLKLDLSWLRKRIPKSDDAIAPALEERMNEMMLELDKSLTAVKTLSTELRPGILDKLGLGAAVEWQCQEFEKRSGIKCNCHLPNKQISISEERSTALFRILQEALANVSRHSKATMVNVELHGGKSHLTLTLSDNGRGIAESEISDPTSLGLLGMRERAEFLGGDFSISGNPASGTILTARVPLNEPVFSRVLQTSDVKGATSRRPPGSS